MTTIFLGARPVELRPRELDRLSELRLTVDDFVYLAAQFVGHPFEFGVRRVDQAQPVLRRRHPLSPSELLSHLEGTQWVFTGCRRDPISGRYRAESVVIDLDAARDPADLYARFDRVIRALGRPSFLFRSSASGGLHLHYALAEPVDLHRLRGPAADGTGIVRRALAGVDLVEQNGRVEIYPRGHYRGRWGVQSRIRVPFGAESRLLDPNDPGLPLRSAGEDGVADLRCARELDAAGRVDVVDLDRWERAALAAPWASGRSASRPAGRPMAPLAAGSCPDMALLRANGLTGPGQLNGAVFALARDLCGRGLPEDEAQADIAAWLEDHHHGHSETYNADPAAARAEADDVVTRVYARYRPCRQWAPAPGLSPFECGTILFALRGSALVSPATGGALSPYKVQRFAFSLVDRAKQWVLTRSGEIEGRLRAAGLTPGDRRFAPAFLAEARAFWPDPSEPRFVVEVPYRMRIAVPGISAGAQTPLWRVLQHAGLFEPMRRASARAHRAEACAVALDFGVLAPDPGALYAALDHGIVALLSPADIRATYSEHHARQLRRARGALPSGAPTGSEPALVRLMRERVAPAWSREARRGAA